MQESSKKHLPSQWWAVADAVDAYESASGVGFPNLREFLGQVAPEHQTAALAELVKVDWERRWNSGQQRKVEDYVQEYPELLQSGEIPLEELVQQELSIRSRCQDEVGKDELQKRFPHLPELSVHETNESISIVNPFPTALQETTPFAEGSTKPATTQSEVAHPFHAEGPPDGLPLQTPGYEFSEDTHNATKVDRSDPNRDPSTQFPTELVGSIGRYRIKARIGAGSFGAVYRCFDEDLKRDVAIKVPHGNSLALERGVQGFLHEARSAARLRHPGIVTVLDASQTEDGCFYIVYEYVEGKNLRQRLEKGDFSYEDAARWVAATAYALHHAHKNGIVHRDVKPANILIDAEGKPYVADFGLAKIDDKFFHDDVGKVLGSFSHMSPEQATGMSHWASPQSDIYSLGMVLFQLLCRRLPFTGASRQELVEQIAKRAPPPPRTIDDKIPKRLEEICLKAIAKDPADRYSTALDMARDLNRAVKGVTGRERWIPLGFAAAIAVAILAIVVPHVWPPASDTGPTASGGTQTTSPGQAVSDGGHVTVVDTATLEIHYQRATEVGFWRKLNQHPATLREGDKVQLHVSLPEPRYVYLYWYDADGKPDRKWPVDVDAQEPVDEVTSPEGEDDWWPLTADPGAEMVLLAVRSDPLSGAELQAFEAQLPYSAGEIQSDTVFQMASDTPDGAIELHPDLERGLGAKVESSKNPLKSQFETELRGTFDSFRAMIIPHR